MAELNSALGSLKFELKEKLLSLESAAALQANNAKEAAAAQAALDAMREELQQAEREAEEAAEMLKMKEIAWEEERKRLTDAQAYNLTYQSDDLYFDVEDLQLLLLVVMVQARMLFVEHSVQLKWPPLTHRATRRLLLLQ